MTLENVLLYIPAAVLIVLMPGPDFAVINRIGGGARPRRPSTPPPVPIW